MSIPADLQYTKEHEWLRVDGDVATIGITAFAAQALGDVIYLDLPEVGAALTSLQMRGMVNATRRDVIEVYPPDSTLPAYAADLERQARTNEQTIRDQRDEIARQAARITDLESQLAARP